MAITIQKIAEMAGVSRGTVDRAINNRGRINPQVEQKILNIANQYGYFAAHTKRGRPRKIGVVTQMNDSPFMIHIREGMETAVRELQERNVKVLLEGTGDRDGERQVQLIDKLLEEKIDGLAIMPADSEDLRKKILEVRAAGIPVITFNSDLEGSGRSCFIGMNNEESGRTGAGLMGMLTGVRGRILVITGWFKNDANSLRVDGFVDEITKSFPGIRLLGVQSSFDKSEEVAEIVKTTYENIGDIDGIFIVCGGEDGIRRALQEVKPAKRPYVIAYDRTPDNEEALRSGTFDFVLGQQGELQGRRALEEMADMLLNGEEPQSEHEYTDTIIITRYNI
ncbi:MAG: LacI family DNA-binding transcriptional regulator [Anaerovoracaceae bacterium]|jgi:LacI family transcriptional regulator